MSDDLCDTCKKGKTVGVACVPGVPMSAAYCKECLEEGASPIGILRANVACCGGVERTDPRYLNGTWTYCDEEYMTLKAALERHPLTEEELRVFDFLGEEGKRQ